MCGICGVLSRNLGYEQKKSIVDKMLFIQRHRGPDDTGSYFDTAIALGHNRLSIIDLESGRQPIYNETQSIVLVYNGEIYNYLELREELLKRGHSFYTNTDSEVIIHAFEEWGEEAFIKFNGMFAFALWDKNEKQLYLGRDRLGIKPLYTYLSDNKLMFASEIKAFHSDAEKSLSIDKYGIVQYFCFQNYYGNSTLYANVERVEPGCVYKYDIGLNRKIIHYYRPVFNIDESKKFDDWVEQFGVTFDDAVKRHLLADVAVGSYLSGGFDSSMVAAVAQKHVFPKRLLTFNGYFAEGANYDESYFAQKVAAKINSDHHSVLITSQDFVREITNVISHLDEPMMGPGAFSQYMVAKEIAKKVKVVLTGHGGDEFFGGYPVYKAALLRENPVKYFDEIFSGSNATDWARILYFSVFPMFRPLLRTGLHILFTVSEIKKMLHPDLFPADSDLFLNEQINNISFEGKNQFEKVQHAYMKGYLSGLFMVEDKISMAHSLESRTPLCDNKLLELSLTIPAKQKLDSGQLKAIIKKSARNYLPNELYNQPKRGFPTPIHLWFKKDLKCWMEEQLLSDNDDFFNKKYIEKMWKDFCSIQTDNLYTYNYGCKLFSILCFKILMNQKTDGKKLQIR